MNIYAAKWSIIFVEHIFFIYQYYMKINKEISDHYLIEEQVI